jgi:hypothetical protein
MTWWDAELFVVEQRVACRLGMSAAQAVLDRDLRVRRRRGRFPPLADRIETTATIDTSTVPSAADRDETSSGLVRDWRTVADRLDGR